MTTPTVETTARNEEQLRELARTGARELGAELSPEGTVPEQGEADHLAAIRWVAENFPQARIAVACSMADAVLPALVADQIPGVDVLFLETGYHFPETEGTKEAVKFMLDVNVVDVMPKLSVAEQDEQHGKDLFSTDPTACCRMRKVEPLAEALQDYDVWFTGVRRDESPTRTNAPLVAFDETHKIVKVNPMVRWSLDELTDYSNAHALPVNPLLSDGFLSIGCAPCTRRVAPGEDPRAGRWSGTDKIECGIHL
ncbi:phosphoadenylyl-sulfate reductase [Kocuria sp. JC486]|uniref:phosphoadenylyl-sulfate reductase n=1 Tax=Kocuria sp. JC486 TaxID=1970736 RepID=UPI00141E00D1|nr:phosphoadenylyl-sulfate reductase [Kocuria sp. JC486]NHU85430.1 phosphoadenylyl-sulfate reductase [Kocuria sp. JC486]